MAVTPANPLAMKLLSAVCVSALLGRTGAMTLRGGVGIPAGFVDEQELQSLMLMGTANSPDVDQLQQLLLLVESAQPTKESFTTKLDKLVTSLSTQVQKAHDQDVKATPKNLVTPFDTCRCEGNKVDSTAGICSEDVDKMEKKVTAQQKKHKTCLVNQAATNSESIVCKSLTKTLSDAKKDTCKDFDAPKDSSTTSCSTLKTDGNRQQWLTHVLEMLQKENKRLKKQKKDCKGLREQLKTETAKCIKVQAKKREYHKECVNDMTQLELLKCSLKDSRITRCLKYDTCYKEAKKEYHIWKNDTMVREHQRKLQHRMLKRLQCLVGAYTTTDKTGNKTAALQACVSVGAYPTDHLNLVYPTVAEKVVCDAGASIECGRDYMPPKTETKKKPKTIMQQLKEETDKLVNKAKNKVNKAKNKVTGLFR